MSETGSRLEARLADITSRRASLTDGDIDVLLRVAQIFCSMVDAWERVAQAEEAVRHLEQAGHESGRRWAAQRVSQAWHDEDIAWDEAEHVYRTGVV